VGWGVHRCLYATLRTLIDSARVENKKLTSGARPVENGISIMRVEHQDPASNLRLSSARGFAPIPRGPLELRTLHTRGNISFRYIQNKEKRGLQFNWPLAV
jgi:hypothetical protein